MSSECQDKMFDSLIRFFANPVTRVSELLTDHYKKPTGPKLLVPSPTPFDYEELKKNDI